MNKFLSLFLFMVIFSSIAYADRGQRQGEINKTGIFTPSHCWLKNIQVEGDGSVILREGGPLGEIKSPEISGVGIFDDVEFEKGIYAEIKGKPRVVITFDIEVP